MLSRTLAVVQSVLLPWDEGRRHARHVPQPEPRPPHLKNFPKRTCVDQPPPSTFRFTKRLPSPCLDSEFTELSSSLQGFPPLYGSPLTPPHHRPQKKRKTLPSLNTGPPEVSLLFRRLYPSLEDLNVDVFRLILEQLQQQEVSVKNLARSSRKIRSFCLPILFSRCKADIRIPGWEDPPESIRAYIRHLTHLGPLDKDADLIYIENLFTKLPFLTSIALEELHGRIPWAVLKACMVLPNLISLSVHHGLYGLRVPLFPKDDVLAPPISIKRFSYGITTWRERFHSLDSLSGTLARKAIRTEYEFERECLLAIVPRLGNTVTSLALPLESAPILAMAKLSWPHLHELALHGRLVDSEHATLLQHLLPALSSLRNLSILAGRVPQRTSMRYPILPSSSIPTSRALQQTNSTSTLQLSDPSSVHYSVQSSAALAERKPWPFPLLPELRSLAIAYPDPEDGLFSLNFPNLAHLSLRDHPRVYHRLTADGSFIPDGPDGGTWPAPLLSSEEYLSLLRRMNLSRLTSLELVYMAHHPDEDDDLLSYIVESLPCLEHLELHRYRGIVPAMRKTEVDHMRIARLLSRARSLRTLRLNLDFHDDHQAYYMGAWERERWFPIFKSRGFEIVDFLQESCSRLEHVALLYHGQPAATWAEFHPQRCAEPRFVLDYTKQHVDSEPCPREWVSLDPGEMPILLSLP